MPSKSVLVTGGAGFIGSNLASELISQGHQVKILDNLDPQVHPDGPSYFGNDFTLIRGDIRDADTVERAIEDVDIIFHNAAAVGVAQSMYRIHNYIDVNSLGTGNLLEVLTNSGNGVKKLVVASSNTVYGEGSYDCPECGLIDPGMRPASQLKEHDWSVRCPNCGEAASPVPTKEDRSLHPTTVYAITKRDQEELCLQVGGAYGIPVVALRYFNVLGPGQSLKNPYTGVCAIFSSRIRDGKAPVVYEDGSQTRDIVSVKDIVQGNMLAMNLNSMNYGIFNVGTGRAISILDIANELLRLHGSDLKPEIPGKFRAGDVRHCFADVSRISSHGYKPKYQFDRTIRDFYEWSKEHQSRDLFDRAQNEMNSRGLII